jgi:hypothetical protein
VFGVPPSIAVQPVSHVNELFRDNQLDGPRMVRIQTFQLHQDGMSPQTRQIDIRSSDARFYPSSQPAFELSAVGSHEQIVQLEVKTSSVMSNPTVDCLG